MSKGFKPNLWVLLVSGQYRFIHYFECMIDGLEVFTRQEFECDLDDDSIFMVEINSNGSWDLYGPLFDTTEHICKFDSSKRAAQEMMKLFKKHTFEKAGTTMWSHLNETMDDDINKYGEDLLDNPYYWVEKFHVIAFDDKFHQHPENK